MVWPLSGGWVSDKCRDVLEEEKRELVLESDMSSWFEVLRDPRRTILAFARKCRLIAHPQNPVVILANCGSILYRTTRDKDSRSHTSN